MGEPFPLVVYGPWLRCAPSLATLDLVLPVFPDLTDCWSYTECRVASDEVKQTLRWLLGLSRVSKVCTKRIGVHVYLVRLLIAFRSF